MSSSKQSILKTLRRQIVDQRALPDSLEGDWIQYADPQDQFRQMIEMVGGSCTKSTREGVLERLREFEQWNAAQRILSQVDFITGNVELEDIEQPHDLENLDFAIFEAEFGVAENGAVWLTDGNLKHRVSFFITQYLVILLDKDKIVHNMHEAYQRAQVPRPGFGLFLSGPSKTADIEQSLVIGAHGCKEMQVYLV